MDNTIVVKENEAYIKIYTDPAIEQELYDYFTFFADKYWFSPKFKHKIWDGKIRLFDKSDKTLYIGLLGYLEEFHKDRDYKLEIHLEHNTRNFSIQEGKEYIESLNISDGKGTTIEARDYQIRGFALSIRNYRNILLSATGSGKSFIIYCISRYLLGEGKRGLLIVPTTTLVEQMYGDFAEYSTKNHWNVQDNCHRIYQIYEKETTKPFVISTWQSIIAMSKNKMVKFLEDFDFVIGDEAHEFTAKSFKTIMTRLVNAEYRIGTSGTLDESKIHKLVLEGLFGPVVELSKTHELIEKGQLAQLKIKNLILKHTIENCAENRRLKSYDKEVKYLNSLERRNKFIVNLALSLKGNTLILFSRIETHGRILFDMINSRKDKGRKAFFIYGATDTEIRNQVRQILETEKDAIVVASGGTFFRGLNIKRLHNIISAYSSKKKIRTLQSIGRALRLSEHKEYATWYDICDDLRIGTFVNYTFKHFEDRLRIYKDEKFKYKNYKINLKD